MKTINRMAITLIPRQPYVDWANSFDDDGTTLDPEELFATSILIPESYDEFNYEGFLKKHCRLLRPDSPIEIGYNSGD